MCVFSNAERQEFSGLSRASCCIKAGNPCKRPQPQSDSYIPVTAGISRVCVRVCVWVRCSCRVMLAHHLTSTPPTLLIIHCVMYSDTCKHTISQCTSTCTLTKQRPLPSHPITFLCRSVLTLCWELSTCSGNRASRWITLLQLFFSLIFLLRSVCLEMFLVKLSFPFLSLSTLPIPSLSYAPVRFILKMSLSPFSPKYNICHIHFF